MAYFDDDPGDEDNGDNVDESPHEPFNHHDKDNADVDEPEKATEQLRKLDAAEEKRTQRATGDESKKEEEKSLFEKLAEEARDLLCKVVFDSRYKPTAEDKFAIDDRSAFDKTVDWLGLDSFQGIEFDQSVGEFVDSFEGAVSDFKENRAQMLKESTGADGTTINVPDRDKYFHTKANAEGNSRGAGGELASALMSTAKEVKDVAKTVICKDWSYEGATQDSMRDQDANRAGRDMGRNGLRTMPDHAPLRLK